MQVEYPILDQFSKLSSFVSIDRWRRKKSAPVDADNADNSQGQNMA